MDMNMELLLTSDVMYDLAIEVFCSSIIIKIQLYSIENYLIEPNPGVFC